MNKKYLLIKDDIVLSFKTKSSRDKYYFKKVAENEVFMIVDINESFYSVINPYIQGTLTDKTQQFYDFNEVLKYCGGF